MYFRVNPDAPVRKFVVYPGAERYRIAVDIEAIPLPQLAAVLNRDR